MAKKKTGRPTIGTVARTAAEQSRIAHTRAAEAAACIGRINYGSVQADRKARCQKDLRSFLVEYLPEAFDGFRWRWSDSHEKLIATIQQGILAGGLRFVDAEPRGFSKTTICEGAVLWAALYGHQQLVPLLSTVKHTALKSMQSVKSELESNARLSADFPEVCQAVAALDGISQRGSSQTYILEGGEVEHTYIEWRADEIVLPTIEGAACRGVVLCVYGIESRKARGLHFKTREGQVLRPGFVLIDDPQDQKIAKNPLRVDSLWKNLHGQILPSGSHRRKIAAAVVATVIEKNDLVDRLLKSSDWVGRRVAMLSELAENEDLWLGDYARIRRDFLRDDAKDRRRAEGEATEFYRQHREEMDKGAVASWQDCFDSEELSAIQHAYNLRIDLGEASFWAECQNDPLDLWATQGFVPLDPRDILAKATALPRGTVPLWAHTLTAFIDVGRRTHVHFCVCAFGSRFTGHVVDFGVVEVKRVQGQGLEASIFDAIARAAGVVARLYPVEGGGEKALDKLLVDSGWQSRVVYNWTRDQARSRPGLAFPSKGYSSERYRVPRPGSGARVGDKWHQALSENRAAVLTHYSTDYWKSFVDARWRVGLGGEGCLSLCRGEALPFAEQVTSERPTKKETRTGEVLDLWAVLPARENHWLDCLVGCHVAASMQGSSLERSGTPRPKVRKKKPPQAPPGVQEVPPRRGTPDVPVVASGGGVRRFY